MQKVIILWNETNQMGFGLRVFKEDFEKVKAIAKERFEAWFDAENHPELYYMGYTEPTTNELDRLGIEYELLDEEEITDENNPDSFNYELNPEIIFI